MWAYGAMSPQLEERTLFSNEDAETIKNVLPGLFEGNTSSAKVHRSLQVNGDDSYKLRIWQRLQPEEVDGF